MNEVLHMILAFITGIISGIIFFGGLWLTVKKSVKIKMPWLLFTGSAVVRTTIVLIAFYYTSPGHMARLLICTLGFVIARQIVFRITETIDQKTVKIKKEASHEA